MYFTIQFDFQGILKRGEFKKGVFKARHILEDVLLVKTRFMKKINTLKHIKNLSLLFGILNLEKSNKIEGFAGRLWNNC